MVRKNFEQKKKSEIPRFMRKSVNDLAVLHSKAYYFTLGMLSGVITYSFVLLIDSWLTNTFC